MPDHPLAEVFGFPADNLTPSADRYRANRLCPYNNKSPNCTKSSVENPIGVCSVFGAGGDVVITCPVRFREDWLIATDAAAFFFPPGATWTSVTEVQLNDRVGDRVGEQISLNGKGLRAPHLMTPLGVTGRIRIFNHNGDRRSNPSNKYDER